MTCWVWRQVGRRYKRILRLTSLRLPSPLPAMARKLRVEYPGAIYHVMNRGDRREAIVKDAADRLQFLETLREACLRSSWQVHAYCLMPNQASEPAADVPTACGSLGLV